jgi:hypothetical protein
MRGILNAAIVITWAALVAAAPVPLGASSGQRASGGSADGTLPGDVHPDSRNRLPPIKRDDLDERGKKVYDEAVSGAASPRSPQEGRDTASRVRVNVGGHPRRASAHGLTI